MSGEDSPSSGDLLREKSDEQIIKDKLKKGGLDPGHWFKVFRDVLEVNIPEEMETIGEESYEELVKHVRRPRDEKALRKFLNMPMDEQSKPEHQDPDEGIKKKLKSAGLDPSYWLAIVKDELKVSIPEELENIGEECYQDLAKHVRKAREEKAIMKLLGMPMDEQSGRSKPDPDEGIKETLKSAGLDPSRWLPIVKDELKVNIPEELVNVGEESYQDLAKHVRIAWEKRAIRKLLGMSEDEQKNLNPERAKKRQALKNYQKAETMLQELRELEQQGKDRCESAVKNIEDGVCEVLEIPCDAWIPEEETLSELTATLQVYMQDLSGVLKEGKDRSDATVLESASDGCALRGVLVSRNTEDWLKMREKLLRAPKDIHFTDLSLPQEDKTDTFSYKHEEANFCNTVERLGLSAAGSAKAGYISFGSELRASFSEKAKDEDHQYISTVKYLLVPMASFLFEDAQLQLSREALGDLKAIEGLASGASGGDLQKQCEAFFEKYGSHANKGDLHFGGIYWWKCYSQGFQSSEMEQVKHLQSQIVIASVKASYGPWGVGGDWSKVIAQVTGNSQTKSKTCLQVTRTGGPQELSDLHQWKNGLVASNSTWSVIDCGTNAVPVWKIIELNHMTDFKDAGNLVGALIKAWETMTKKQRKCVSASVLKFEAGGVEDMLKQVCAWNKSKDPSRCAECLNELLRTKSNLAKSKIHLAWPDLYLSKVPIQQYLKWVVDAMQGKNTKRIKPLMQQLLEPSDVDAVKNFPDKDFILKWINRLPDSEPPESVMPGKPQHPEIQNIFQILGVSKYYPQKLTRKHALCIRQQTPESKQFYILEKIMMHNYQYWKCLIQNDAFILHPVDCLLALLLCADNFLRQDLLVKISTCKLAIPLLLPDPLEQSVTLPLWGMRSIVKEWKCKDTDTGATTLMESSMVECEIPIVSFMRFSDSDPDSGRSKSKILNEVIGNSQHNFFFHWDCEGGSAKRLLVDGVVELCWYLPTGKEADSFNKAIAFTNLRGDARKHRRQFEFLRQVSFMNFVLLTQADLDEESITVLEQLAEAPGLLVLMFPDTKEEESLPALSMAVYKIIKMKRKNLAKIKSEVRSHITANLHKHKVDSALPQFKTLKECCDIAEQAGINIDENDQDCIAGHGLAEDVLHKVREVKDGDSSTGIKDKMLPLQSQAMWHTWAQYNKERHRHINKGIMTTEAYSIEMDSKKDEIRKKQFSLCDPSTPVMKSFMSSLLQKNGYVRDYFLHWLKFLLDRSSRQTLPPLQIQYDRLKCDLQKPSPDETTGNATAKKERKTREELAKKNIREELAKVNDEMILASLGLEHLFRELGQMYESMMDVSKEDQNRNKDLKSQISRLPGVAAELLVAGYPFELMDGDASHVPMIWMMAVLDKLHKLLKHDGDAKVFAVSVLGIQSSGKSTLMNTMFGVKFAVSAGRCTRGAFIQLIPIQKGSQPCDYLLVVDTEGLRAPELDSQKMLKRDNEMATFVMGLANVTIINIFGETPADMQDILQTSVHAFLRMKKLELKPSCQFVHQNVTAIAADTKLTQGKANLVENLNEMVKYAAKQEQCERNYTTFDQVMSFDLERDVWYFPSLWKGDPPMAPVNPGYSERAEGLKSALTEIATTAKSKFSITAFRKHIEALWGAVLSESFVFSFKNMLEMTAYNELDCKRGQWSSELLSSIMNLQSELENKVFSSDVTELDGLQRELIAHLEKVVQELQNNLLKQAEEFFKNCGEHVDIMIQWKEQTKQNLIHLCEKHRDQTDDYCRYLIHNRRDRVALDNLRTNIYQKIQEPVRKLALELRGKTLHKKELEQKFNHLWDRLRAQELTAKSQKIDVNVEPSVESSLKVIFRQKAAKELNEKLTACGLKQRGEKPLQLLVETHHFASGGWWQTIKGLFKESCQIEADKQTKVFLKDAEKHLKVLCSRVKDYSEALSHQVLRKLCDDVDKYNEGQTEFNFTEGYKIDLSLTVAGHAVKQFKEMIRENAPSTIFEKLREPFYIRFESQYSQRSIEQAAAKSLSSYLKGPIQTAVIDSLVPEVVRKVKLHDERFHTKHGLLYNILLDLEKKRSFADYIVYLKNVEESLHTWIKVYTLEYCNTVTEQGGQSTLQQLGNAQLDAKVCLIKDSAEAATQSPPKTLRHWLTKFHEPLKSSFQLNLEEICQFLGVVDTSSDKDKQPDFEFFNAELIKHLQDVEEEIRGTLKSLPEEMKTWKCRPYDVLADEMMGCCKQCPFCKTKCEYMDPDHPGDHHVSIHRPQCLGGYRYTATNEFTLGVCTTSVEGNGTFQNQDTDNKRHPYRKYREIYEDWMIQPNSSRYDSSFWKYFVAHYTDELAEHFRMKKPSAGSDGDRVLQEWKRLEREKVLETLKASFGL